MKEENKEQKLKFIRLCFVKQKAAAKAAYEDWYFIIKIMVAMATYNTVPPTI